jgi:hypothetical protein
MKRGLRVFGLCLFLSLLIGAGYVLYRDFAATCPSLPLDEIEPGMTLRDVDGILGPPDEDITDFMPHEPGHQSLKWNEAHGILIRVSCGWVIVEFKDGKVVGKSRQVISL